MFLVMWLPFPSADFALSREKKTLDRRLVMCVKNDNNNENKRFHVT